MIRLLVSIFAKDIQSIKSIKASKQRRILTNLLVVVLVFGIFFAMLAPLLAHADEIKSSIPIDLGSLTLLLGAYITFALAIVSSVGFVFSSCYLDKNLENYLVMPLSARDFTVAKLISAYRNVIILIGTLYLPFIILYFYFGEVSIVALLITLIYVITMPIVAIYLVTLVISIIMLFVNRVKNKVLAKNVLFVGSFLVVFGAYMYVVLKFSYTPAENVTATLNMVFDLIEKVQMFLFYPTWYVDVFNNQEYFKLLYFVIALLVCIPIQLLFEKIYYKGSIGFNQNNSTTKKRRKNKNSGIAHYSETRWFFYREFREITKTMTYFMNSIFGNILIVVIYLGMMGYAYFFGGVKGSPELEEVINNYLDVPVIILVTIVIATFFTIFNNGAATVFSRDAKALDFIDTLPINQARAFFGKVLFHGLVEFLTIFIFMVIPMLVLGLNPLYIIVSVITMIIIMLATIFIPITIDLNFPTLNWESETAVVKRGKSVLLAMLAHFLLSVVVIGGGIALIGYLHIDYKILAYIGLGFYVILFVVMYFVYQKSVTRAFNKVRQ